MDGYGLGMEISVWFYEHCFALLKMGTCGTAFQMDQLWFSLFLSLSQFCVEFHDLVGFLASLTKVFATSWFRITSLKFAISNESSFLPVWLAMLSEGILSEIESICWGSVGKKESKKWVQFVSLAANKIRSSAKGERNEYTSRVLFGKYTLKNTFRKTWWSLVYAPGYVFCGKLAVYAIKIIVLDKDSFELKVLARC